MKTHIQPESTNGSQPGTANGGVAHHAAGVKCRSVRRMRAFLRSGDEGSALVEIALIMGPLLALMTAIFTFAIAFNNQLTLTQAVGSGAQYLQQLRNNTTDPCAATLTAIENAAPNLTPAKIGLTLSLNGTQESGSTCTGGASLLNGDQGDPVTVTATYPCFLSIMPLGYGTHFVSSCQLSATVTEYEY